MEHRELTCRGGGRRLWGGNARQGGKGGRAEKSLHSCFLSSSYLLSRWNSGDRCAN
jgi:hypothetical protein